MESKIKEYLISQAVLNEDGTQKRFFFSPVYKTRKARVIAKAFGNPLWLEVISACFMVSDRIGEFHRPGTAWTHEIGFYKTETDAELQQEMNAKMESIKGH